MKSSNNKPIPKHAFSLIELSIVILIIGILVAGVTQSSRLVKRMRIAFASHLTTNSDVNLINDLTMWLESVQDFAFATGTNASFDFNSNVYNDVDRPSDQDRIGRWNDESMRNSSSKKSAIQNNLALQPKYVENGINNLPALYFDGSGQGVCMHAPVNIDRAMMPNLTIFAVYRWTTIETGSTQKLWGSDNGGWDRQAIMGAPFVGISYGSGAAGIPNFGNRNVNQIFSHVSRVGVGNGSMAYINGQSPT